MTPEAVWREAWRDIRSGTARTVTFFALLVVVVVGLGTADAITVRTLIVEAETYQQAGASIVTLTAPGLVDPSACDALGAVPGVRAAGATRTGDESISPAALPSSTIPVVTTSPTFPAVLRATTHGTGVLLSEHAATSLDVRAGDLLRASGTSAVVAGTYAYPDDGRTPGLGFAVLVPTADPAPFDECWVDIWPASPQTPVLLRTALLPGGGDDRQPPVLAQLNSTLGTSFDGGSRFDARVTRSAPLVALGLGAALGALMVYQRRTLLASALHAGVARRDLATILALEILSWTVPTGLVAAAGAALLVSLGSDGALAVLAARPAAAGLAGPFVGAAVSFALTRERHLFRYFKDR